MVFSATSASAALGAGDPMTFLVKQGAYALDGAAAARSRVALRLPPACGRSRRCCSSGSLALCIAVLVIAPPINGARRWFLVGPISVQPSEVAKIAICIWACALLARRPTPRTMGELMKPLGLVVGLFSVLILLEPDLGTTIALCIMVAGILLVSEVPLRLLALAGSIALVLGAAAIYMEPYRRDPVPQLRRPLAGSAGRGLPDRAGDHRHGLGRDHRRGARAGNLEDLLSPGSAHRHDLRDRRRGARVDRLDDGDRRVRASSPGPASGSLSSAATRSGSGSPRASRRSSAGRPPSISAPCSGSLR